MGFTTTFVAVYVNACEIKATSPVLEPERCKQVIAHGSRVHGIMLCTDIEPGGLLSRNLIVLAPFCQYDIALNPITTHGTLAVM